MLSVAHLKTKQELCTVKVQFHHTIMSSTSFQHIFIFIYIHICNQLEIKLHKFPLVLPVTLKWQVPIILFEQRLLLSAFDYLGRVSAVLPAMYLVWTAFPVSESMLSLLVVLLLTWGANNCLHSDDSFFAALPLMTY